MYLIDISPQMYLMEERQEDYGPQEIATQAHLALVRVFSDVLVAFLYFDICH